MEIAGKPRRHLNPSLCSYWHFLQADVCSTASIVPIVCSACDVAWNIKDLIKNVKQHDEKMKDLENKLDNLNFILEHAKTAYGQNEGRSYSSPEQDIRKTIENVVIGCNKDLKRFEGKIKSLLAAGNWASVAWKQKSNAPELADIGKSLSERQQRLSLLVQLLQGLVIMLCRYASKGKWLITLQGSSCAI